jgi:putative transposase
MARKKHTAEQIIGKLREIEVGLAAGRSVAEMCRSIAVSEQTYYRWRAAYGGLKLDQAKRLKELERENGRLRKAVAELTLDKLILKEAAEGTSKLRASPALCRTRARAVRCLRAPGLPRARPGAFEPTLCAAAARR